MAMPPDVHVRVARPTDHIDEVVRFYRDGLGFQLIGSFERNGTTFEDPDGYRVVLAKARWSL